MLEIASPAKINWFLHVGPRRPDGFHELETVFQELDLHDTVRLTPAATTTVRCSDPAVASDESNLAYRAWSLAHERWGAPAVRIEIEKLIPAGGGLAGGSSNAAAVMLGLVQLFELHVPQEELKRAALEIGSDVPFFLVGGCAYARGRGELLEPLDVSPDWPLLLILPDVPVATPRAFGKLAELRAEGLLPVPEFCGIEQALQLVGSSNPRELLELRNDLERPVFELEPQVAAAARAAVLAGAPMVRMSGSGSTIWAAFESNESRASAREQLESTYRTVEVSARQRTERPA